MYPFSVQMKALRPANRKQKKPRSISKRKKIKERKENREDKKRNCFKKNKN